MTEKTKTVQSGGGVSFLTLLGLLFIGLKLTDYIDWSWWWVLSPFWLPWAVFLIIGAIALVVSLFTTKGK